MLPSNTIVHGMWIGETLSPLELLTIKSFVSCGHSFWLWTYDAIQTPLPEGTLLKDARQVLPEAAVFRYQFGNQFGHGKGSLAGFSDIFRYKLLYEYGGWWADMDITCLPPLHFEAPYVFRSHDVFPVVGNLMKCPPHSALMRDCFERASALVHEKNADWLLPIRILNEAIEQQGLSKYIKDISNADRWEQVQFYTRFPAKLPDRYYVLHWMNEEWRARSLSKNTCTPYGVLDTLMTQHAIPITRQLPPDKLTYIWQWLKIILIPLLPQPLRRGLKALYFGIRRGLSSILRFYILPLIPRSWKNTIKQRWHTRASARKTPDPKTTPERAELLPAESTNH